MSFPLVEKRVKFSTSSAAIFSGEKLSYAPSDTRPQRRAGVPPSPMTFVSLLFSVRPRARSLGVVADSRMIYPGE